MYQNTHPVRRTDRQITIDEIITILNNGLYGTLATSNSHSEPYAVPLFYIYRANAIYFHCADEGHKLINISQNNKVCFNVVTDVEVIPQQFSAFYKSATAFGTATLITGEEKKTALVDLIKKYTPAFYDEGMNYIEKMYDKTTICKISIDSLTGKARKK